MDHLCYLCIVFVMLLGPFITALWSAARKMLTYWFSFVVLNCVFVTFPCGILGQVWNLIVLIPDLCPLSYFIRYFCLLGLWFYFVVNTFRHLIRKVISAT